MLTGSRLLRASLSGWSSGTPALGFPDASNTGPTVPDASLFNIVFGTPYSASSPGIPAGNVGWSVTSTGGWHIPVGSVLSKLNIPFQVDVAAMSGGITVKDCIITNGGTGSFICLSLRGSIGTVIQDCIIRGIDATANRASEGVRSINGTDSGLVVQRCEFYFCRTCIYAYGDCTGRDNYMHDPGHQGSDHCNGFISQGANPGAPLVAQHNTIIWNFDQTSPLTMVSNGATGPVQYITMDGNLLAGGTYCAYLGNDGTWIAANPGTTNHVVFTNNRISRQINPNGGTFGPYTAFDPSGVGNVFSGNVWHETGVPIT